MSDGLTALDKLDTACKARALEWDIGTCGGRYTAEVFDSEGVVVAERGQGLTFYMAAAQALAKLEERHPV